MMLKGFDSDIFDSQAVFRKVLRAMANPGTIEEISLDMVPPERLHPASGAILLSLLDFETPFWSDLENASPGVQWLRFHTGAPYTRSKQNALFALYTESDNVGSPALFNPGTIESPDISTTLMVQTSGVGNFGRIRLTGPGIKKQAFLDIKGVGETFLKNRAELYNIYPLGVDMIFVCDRFFVAIPRTTNMEIL